MPFVQKLWRNFEMFWNVWIYFESRFLQSTMKGFFKRYIPTSDPDDLHTAPLPEEVIIE